MAMKCFTIMPFSEDFSDVYATIRRAVNSIDDLEIEVFRLGDNLAPGRISQELIQSLDDSKICIADLTGSNPNVMWEIGYAMALGKPVIFLSQNLAERPFDLVDMRTINYSRERLSETLENQLATVVRATVGAFVLSRETATTPLPKASVMSIAVTGSMHAKAAKCLRRLDTLLEPYLDRDITWYCGSYGETDELVCKFLLERGEKVVVVGYDAYDISEKMLKYVVSHGLPFVDASREQLPPGFSGPTDRDRLFYMRADVIILLWNGRSSGIKEMIDWYQTNGKDHIVGFVG